MVDLAQIRLSAPELKSVVNRFQRLDRWRCAVALLLAITTMTILSVMTFYAIECGSRTSVVCGQD
jgi:hypothetical protein